ncbi:MAG: aspartate--tRNA ligase [Chlamydiales bacterium]|nr:aspartate--tRNA ligase [Chlamydiales bacterium]
MFDYRRTHTCSELNKSHANTFVTLSGWVHRRRDHGNLIFIDLRDRYGITQLVFDPKVNEDLCINASKLRSEWVISIKGKVSLRKDGMHNAKMATGDIEIEVLELEILSKAKTPPFSISDETIDVNEELRLKYRYLDLRRGDIANKLILRHKATLAIRTFLDSLGFLEITTPILAKSTPEGARDYLVPSRVHHGHFYALPQSPQIFKQILMIAGLDKYFQIATCFRDEDLRADRQPEFAQIDIEMSFVTPEEVFKTVEGLISSVFMHCLNTKVPTTFKRMTFHECQELYGTDKPDLRFAMPFIRLDDVAKDSTAPFFHETLKNGGIIKAICIPSGHDLSRKTLDEYAVFATKFGLQGTYYTKLTDEGLSTGIAKFFDETIQKKLIEQCKMQPGDLLLLVEGNEKQVNQTLDHLRRRIARERGLIDFTRFEFLWVTDFPLFKWNDEENCIEAEHHPFTSPSLDDLHLIETDPLKMRSSSYDLVLNGYELASGSQRIHSGDLQEKIFKYLKLSEKEITERFGFFIEALKYGTPPHAGIALGLDRLVMILTKTENIKEVVAFPKTQKACDLMTEAPSTVLMKQLNELKISIEKE